MRAVLLLLVCLFAARPAAAADAVIDAMIEQARSTANAGECERPGQDGLERVLCRGVIRIGVRSNYPGFGARNSETEWRGYEIDLAHAVAVRLGVRLQLVAVTPANRIAMLLEGRVDLVIATMGHTVLRDAQVRFIRPHYYLSRTVIIGDRRVAVEDEAQLRGRTVCVPIGNADTARLAGEGARLLIFDNPQQMLDALRMDICTLAMHDDSFFSTSFADPHFRLRFEPKLSVSSLPWGMATARDDALARLLDLLSARWHAEGRLVALAQAHPIERAFLEAQRPIWRSAGCRDADGGPALRCLEPPVDISQPATAIAHHVEAFEAWFLAATGIALSLPMLKSRIAMEFFLRGIVFSLLLVAGSLATTFGFGMLFGAALCCRNRLIRIPMAMLTGVLQCSPLVLLLFFGYALVSTLTSYSTFMALLLSIVMIGLYNGSHAARAIADGHVALRAKSEDGTASFADALQGASVQIMSFLVNATKSSSVASMIGVPELLNALTDITSFTSERVMTYSFLMVFYSLLVLLVVWATRLLSPRLRG